MAVTRNFDCVRRLIVFDDENGAVLAVLDQLNNSGGYVLWSVNKHYFIQRYRTAAQLNILRVNIFKSRMIITCKLIKLIFPNLEKLSRLVSGKA